MTVVFVVYGKLDERSGGFLYDCRLKTALEERGHRVVTVAQRDGALFRKVMQNGPRLVRRIDAVNPDIVLIDELNHPSVFLSIQKLKRHNHRLVSLVHHLRSSEKDLRFGRRLTEMMERMALADMDGFIFNSPATSDNVRRLLGTPALNGITATPGADNPYEEPRKMTETARFLFVGNIIPRKGLHRLIRVLLGIRTGTWTLDVCGNEKSDPGYARRCRHMAAQSDDSGQIRFHGRLNQTDLDSLRRSCDVLAVPSDHEGFGIVYLEAMRAAMVPVASADGGAGTLIRDGIDGFLIPPDDEERLETVLRHLVDSSDLRRRIAESAHRRARSFPDWKTSMSRAAEFLEDLVG